jgi:hypothetical protein
MLTDVGMRSAGIEGSNPAVYAQKLVPCHQTIMIYIHMTAVLQTPDNWPRPVDAGDAYRHGRKQWSTVPMAAPFDPECIFGRSAG